MIKIGVVGVGAWGYIHLKRLIENSENYEIEVSGFYDINKERVKYVTNVLNVKYLELDKLISSVDGLIIATPPTTHAKIALKAVEKGVHLLVEKPFTANIEDAIKLHKLSRKYGSKILVGYIMRFHPVVKELKKKLLNNELGDPVVISSKRVGPRGRRIRDVGVILDLATHDIDISRFILEDEPREVYSIYGSMRGEYEDYAIIALKYSDVTVLIETNLLTPYKVRNISITCTNGVLYGDYMNRTVKIAKNDEIKEYTLPNIEPLVEEHKHFINVIKGVEEPICTSEDGIRVLKIAFEALKNKIS